MTIQNKNIYDQSDSAETPTLTILRLEKIDSVNEKDEIDEVQEDNYLQIQDPFMAMKSKERAKEVDPVALMPPLKNEFSFENASN